MMSYYNCLPSIKVDLDSLAASNYYSNMIQKKLCDVLPPHFFKVYENQGITRELIEYFQSLFPLTYCKTCKDAPAKMSFIIVYNNRMNAFKFCYEMISRWLLPSKRMDVSLMYTVDFTLPELGNRVYTLCEVVFCIDNRKELDAIQRNLPMIESEISRGVVSSYYARRILEIKGLSCDEKTAMVQDHIVQMMARRPDDFTYDVFTEMQHMLISCRDDFKSAREVKHLSRIVCAQYFFRKSLRSTIKQHPDKRHLYLKLFKAQIRLEKGEKPVLGLIVAVNFLRDKEIIEETHLIKAIRNYIPLAASVPHSFIFSRRGNEPLCVLYLEIMKATEEDFSKEEMDMLRSELASELEGRIEHLTHPVFMPRNEEEVMRNILTLGQQIKFVRDIPQIFITFDEQAHLHLFFTVILVRAIKADSLSIQELFNQSHSLMEYVHDRSKIIGRLRKAYKKEATVFRLKVPKEPFLRKDHSIDLYKARQAVVSEIAKVVGEVRDYNGGMISKQNELLTKARELLKGSKKYNELLLENFFFSLHPVIMRTVLEPVDLKKLFLMLLESISRGFYKEDNYTMNIRAEPDSVYVMIAAEDRRLQEEVKKLLASLKIRATSLVSSCVNINDMSYLGYIYRCDDPLKQRKFCISLQHAVESCEQMKGSAWCGFDPKPQKNKKSERQQKQRKSEAEQV